MWSVSDPVSRLGLATAVILIAAKIGGDLAVRAKQPSVLGELVAGVVLGSLPIPALGYLRDDPSVDMLARIGVLVLLFQVGLESTVREVLSVGVAAGRVAALGTIGSLACGWLAAVLTMPGAPTMVHLFVAASITATSIGISARVLKDAGATKTREAHTILGAAVIDDVFGLVLLAIISGVVVRAGAGGAIGAWRLLLLVGKTIGFLALALVLGRALSPSIFRATARLRAEGALVAAGLSFCFLLAWASDLIGLAPIVGAFTAGLVLEEDHSALFVERGERSLSDRMEPISSWLVPIFFVLMGMRADVRALGDPATLALAVALSVAAIVGKLTSALGAPAGSDRLAIALGMVPRGEVSLVFANLGLSLKLGGAPLLAMHQYSALVGVVVVTSLLTPVVLRKKLRAAPPA